MDDDAHEVRRAGQLIDLTATEYRLLRYLLAEPAPGADPLPAPRPRLELRLRRRRRRARDLHQLPEEEDRLHRAAPASTPCAGSATCSARPAVEGHVAPSHGRPCSTANERGRSCRLKAPAHRRPVRLRGRRARRQATPSPTRRSGATPSASSTSSSRNRRPSSPGTSDWPARSAGIEFRGQPVSWQPGTVATELSPRRPAASSAGQSILHPASQSVSDSSRLARQAGGQARPNAPSGLRDRAGHGSSVSSLPRGRGQLDQRATCSPRRYRSRAPTPRCTTCSDSSSWSAARS